jgi:hypothetical protein
VWTGAASTLFEGLMARTHLSRPSDIAQVVVEEAQRALSARDVVVYWVNRERSALVPIANEASPHRDQQVLESTVAGRCYTTSKILPVDAEDGSVRVWVPLIDGTDRLGALEVQLPADVANEDAGLPEGLVVVLERFGHAVAMMLALKLAYGDTLELVQRSRAMDLGAELLWSMVPPLTFATDGLVISAMLEPAYENGGDAFDYAVNEDLAHVALFDGSGHGLAAAGLSTFAMAAYRHSRRTGLDLEATYDAIDAAISENFTDDRFVTAVLGRLDVVSGRFRWISAGHPAPLLLRDGRVVKVLENRPSTPFGVPLSSSRVTVHEEHLEPGDTVVLYTDGVTEARRPDGSFLEVAGLVEFLEHEAAARQPAPETLRRLQRSLLGAQGTLLRDDATVLVVEWNRGTEELLIPQTVLD